MTLQSYFRDSALVIEQTASHLGEARVMEAVDMMVSAIRQRKVILACGNGGSASDAMHITGELVGRFLMERRPFKAVCLSSNPAVITAWSNDYSYESVFSRQVEAYAEAGAVLIGLSTSGNSPNVVEAFASARSHGMKTIAFTGSGGGKLAGLSDILLDVPSRSTPLIQQAHICLYHFICEQAELKVVESERPAAV